MPHSSIVTAPAVCLAAAADGRPGVAHSSTVAILICSAPRSFSMLAKPTTRKPALSSTQPEPVLRRHAFSPTSPKRILFTYRTFSTLTKPTTCKPALSSTLVLQAILTPRTFFYTAKTDSPDISHRLLRKLPCVPAPLSFCSADETCVPAPRSFFYAAKNSSPTSRTFFHANCTCVPAPLSFYGADETCVPVPRSSFYAAENGSLAPRTFSHADSTWRLGTSLFLQRRRYKLSVPDIHPVSAASFAQG